MRTVRPDSDRIGHNQAPLDPLVIISSPPVQLTSDCPYLRSKCPRRIFHRTATCVGFLSLRRAFPHFAARGSVDVLCLRGSGIRVGYRSGRAVIALTANRHYSLRGARPGMRFSRRAPGLHLRGSYRIAAVTWYLTSLHGATGLLRVRHGVISEVGIAVGGLTDGAHARRFLAGFH